MDLGETTVLIGPNNAGKTAILDALRISLTQRWGYRGKGFSEYDVHMADENTDPKSSCGVTIEIRAEEKIQGEWPEAITSDLGNILQVDIESSIRSVNLRTRCRWNSVSEIFEPSWEFLDKNREPLTGAHGSNLRHFRNYLPVFYLGALRDVKDEFSVRSSQFWTRLLKEINISPKLEAKALKIFDLLNRKFLKDDPRLEDIARTLTETTRVAAQDTEGGLDLRMVPLKTWDMLSRTEIILRNEEKSPWLPLRSQGQGIQSLSVIFLFQAFVDHLLQHLYRPESKPILALEEPETHLHPQAIRTLWHHVKKLPGQKIVTTHSPYFVQNVPFRDLRLVRLVDGQTKIISLPVSFSVSIPELEKSNQEKFEQVISYSNDLFYNNLTKQLTVKGALEKKLYKKLLSCCGADENRKGFEKNLKELYKQSSYYVNNDDLKSLETYAQRSRGEILFAERWLIVEGQADYLLIHAIALAMDYDLDRYGVSVIDAQNNGEPAIFAALARALGIPWIAVFDGDDAGNKYIHRIKKKGFANEELENRCYTHSSGNLEEQLISDKLGSVLMDILRDIGKTKEQNLNNEDLLKKLDGAKTDYARELAVRIRNSKDLLESTPIAFRKAIEKLRGLA